MRRAWVILVTLSALFGATASVLAEERFPPPEFETGYVLPTTAQPPPPGAYHLWLDPLVLLAALSLAAYFALRRRSRNLIVALSVFCLAYLGFWREGCVRPIGSIQNVTLAAFDHAYALPVTVALFFALPLAFALFFGRVFCSGVCPLGAVQDLVLLKPLKLPAWVDHALGLLAYIYLGAAVLLAATGSRFLICEYDPFVAFFRRSGSLGMLTLGAGFLLVGAFIGRPYCRFFCPYGVLLRLVARFSKWNVRIAPKECINCRLCEQSCPFNAIVEPTERPTPTQIARAKRRLVATMGLAAVLIVVGIWLGGRLSGALAAVHPTVKIAGLVQLDEQARTNGPNATVSDEVAAFRKTGQPSSELFVQARQVQQRFRIGGWLLGAWVGLVIGGKLVQLSLLRGSGDYQADRAGCVACGRCFDYCPKEQERRGLVLPALTVEGK